MKNAANDGEKSIGHFGRAEKIESHRTQSLRGANIRNDLATARDTHLLQYADQQLVHIVLYAAGRFDELDVDFVGQLDPFQRRDDA